MFVISDLTYLDLKSQISDLKSQISSLRSQISNLKHHTSVPAAPIAYPPLLPSVIVSSWSALTFRSTSSRPLGQRTSTRSTRAAGSQTEVALQAEVALVRAATVYLGDLHEIAGHDADPCPDAVSIPTRSAEPDLEPVVIRLPSRCAARWAGPGS